MPREGARASRCAFFLDPCSCNTSDTLILHPIYYAAPADRRVQRGGSGRQRHARRRPDRPISANGYPIMKKLLLTSFLVLIPLVAAAQQGRVLFDLAVQFDFELPPERKELRDQIPSESITSMVLLFNESESLMKAAPEHRRERAIRRITPYAGVYREAQNGVRLTERQRDAVGDLCQP